MSVELFVEGGGDGKDLQIECRKGFRRLLEKAGFAGRMPRIWACGPRTRAYEDFRIAARAGEPRAILLVDSEDAVNGEAWQHLRARDGWERPAGVDDDQAQLMVTCMETWLMADRTALRSFFGSCLQESALYQAGGLEDRTRQDVQVALEQATRNCGRERAYAKGKRSFQLLAEVKPEALDGMPHFHAFIEALGRHLPQREGPGRTRR